MMPVDPENPVVKLCALGITLEGEKEKAALLYLRAWEESRDPYEASIAAHYLARVQQTPEETLHWNKTALEKADAVEPPARVEGFYPSLYLNYAKSLEDLGQKEEAARNYRAALNKASLLPGNPYLDFLSRGMHEGLKRVSSTQDGGTVLPS